MEKPNKICSAKGHNLAAEKAELVCKIMNQSHNNNIVCLLMLYVVLSDLYMTTIAAMHTPIKYVQARPTMLFASV